MSRVIRIDRDVWAVIKHAKKTGESNNAALKRLLKEKALTPQDRYFIGFHFAEKSFDLREFGLKLLKTLSKSKNKLGRQARQKVGMLSTA